MTDTDAWFDDSLAAARRGEAAGFDALYGALGGPVTAFAMSRGANDPEGITNEVFVDVFRRIDSFDGEYAGFRSWVFAIARNRLIDAHRREVRQPILIEGVSVDAATPSAEHHAMKTFGDVRVDALMTKLTDDQREVIMLRIVADLPLADVAKIVGKPVTAVKRLQARGLRRLEQEILAERSRNDE